MRSRKKFLRKRWEISLRGKGRKFKLKVIQGQLQSNTIRWWSKRLNSKMSIFWCAESHTNQLLDSTKFRQSRKSASNSGRNTKTRKLARLSTRPTWEIKQMTTYTWIRSVFLQVKSIKAPTACQQTKCGNPTGKIPVKFNKWGSQSHLCRWDSRFRSNSFSCNKRHRPI